MARAVSRRAARGCERGAPRPGGPLRTDRTISLAFVTALQVLPPRQLAVLVLRDVLGLHASEVADMLDSSVDSVNSALKRARAGLHRQMPATTDREPPPAAGSPSEDAIAAKFARAWESADLDALVALLTRRRRLDAADALRVPGPGCRRPLLLEHLPLRPAVRPRADASQWSAGIRRVPACPDRYEPRDRP